MVKGKAYYLGHLERPDIRCEGGTVYYYTGSRRDGKYNLSITQRALQDFRVLWSGYIVIPDLTTPSYDNVLKIASIQKTSDGVTLNLVNRKSG